MVMYVLVCAIIMTVAGAALEIVQYRDFRKGDPDTARSYTFSGMLRRMWKERRDIRKAKRAERKSKKRLS